MRAGDWRARSTPSDQILGGLWCVIPELSSRQVGREADDAGMVCDVYAICEWVFACRLTTRLQRTNDWRLALGGERVCFCCTYKQVQLAIPTWAVLRREGATGVERRRRVYLLGGSKAGPSLSRSLTAFVFINVRLGVLALLQGGGPGTNNLAPWSPDHPCLWGRLLGLLLSCHRPADW